MSFDPTTISKVNFRNTAVNKVLNDLLSIEEATAIHKTLLGTASVAGVLASYVAPHSASLGSAEKTIYCWLFPSENDVEEDPCILLFYKPDLDPSDTLGLLDEGGKSLPLLREVTAGKDYWLFHCNVEGYAVPEDLFNSISDTNPKDFIPKTLQNKKLPIGTSFYKKVASKSLESVFNFPEVIPFNCTSVWANFNDSYVDFTVALTRIPTENWLGDSFKFNKLEAGIISSYQDNSVSFDQVYLTADVELWETSAFFFAQMDFEDSKPRGMNFEVHPGMRIDVSGGLEKLGELISGTQLNIPESIPHPDIAVQYINGYIDFSSGLSSLSGVVACTFADDGWSPFGNGGEDLFSLQEVDVEFSWQKGEPVNWQIVGNVVIASYNLHASYVHPAKIISAQLSPSNSSKRDISDFLSSSLNVPEDASEIAANALAAVDLSLYYDINYKELDFIVRNHESWDLIPEKLLVSGMDLRIKKAGGTFVYAEMYLDLILPIGPDKSKVLVELEGAYDKSDLPALWHFEAEINDPIAVGDLIKGLTEKFGASPDSIPNQIKELTLDDVFLSFDHQGDESQIRFSGNLLFSLSDDRDFNLHLEVDVQKTEGAWEIHFNTWLMVGGYQFAVAFDTNDNGNMLVAYFKGQNGAFHLASLLEEIAPNEIDALIPDDLHLGLQYAFIAFYSPKASEPQASEPQSTPATKLKTTVTFGLELEIGGNLDLGDVPGIGPILGKAEINLESMRVVGSTVDMDDATLGVIDGKLEGLEIKGLGSSQADTPASPPPKSTGSPTPPAFRKGVGLAAELQLPGLIVKLAHFFGQKSANSSNTETGERAPTDDSAAEQTAVPSPPSTPADTQKNRMLQPIGKQIGPFFVESIGLAMMDGKFGLKFTGGVAMGPTVLELINFSVVSPFDRFAPSFDLDGIAIGYDQTPLTVSGLLMKVEETKPADADEKSITQHSIGFRGGISIGFKQISITALGAYSQVKEYDPPGHFEHSFHSFFLYGYLGSPLGGPPFFFVTGLTLGTGFNRGLNLPKPEGFGLFPLTAAALKPTGTALTVKDMKDMMLSLDDYIPIKEGNFWLAAGIKFESFKFLSGFLMLTAEFGDELEIGVLGIVDANMPVAPADPIICISIGFTARILPERGVIEVRGSFLPTTFILHEDVKLQGGMALLAVMKDQTDGEWMGAKAGEFIFTLGGYGPLYQPKSFYPTVPALRLDWKVNSNLFISASAYFALTPEAIMLGGHFHGHFEESASIVRVAVDFKLGADFIIYWQPLRYLGEASTEFHLDGSIHIEKAFLSFDKSLSMDASANLTIWGPDFSGHANLHLHFIVSFSVDVEFGEASKKIEAIDWRTFKDALLPADDKVVSLNLVGGLIQEAVAREVPTVNPLEARLVLDTQIPVKRRHGQFTKNHGKPGIKPMGLTAAEFQSNLLFTIKRDNKEESGLFEFKPLYKNVPAALWQPAELDGEIPGKCNDALIENLVCGYELIAKKPTLKMGAAIDVTSPDGALIGPVEQPTLLVDSNWSEQTAVSEKLIKAFQSE